MLRNLMLVGTSPPATIFNHSRYQRALRANDQPFLDWEWESQMSRNVSDLAEMLSTSTDESLPPFINSFPDIVSAKYEDMSQLLSEAEVKRYDTMLRAKFLQLGKGVVVMWGARPTRMFPYTQRNQFLSVTCANADLHWVSADRCVFVMWIPHHGLRAYSTRVAPAANGEPRPRSSENRAATL